MCLQIFFFLKADHLFSKKSPTGPTERTPQPSNLLRGPLVRSQSIFDGCLFPPQQNKILSMCNNSCTITRVVSNKLYNLNPLRKIHPSWRAYVAIRCNWLHHCRVLTGVVFKGRGTLWSLWGTLGKIRGITTPPLNPITSDLPWLDGRRPTKLDVPSALKFQMYLGAFFTPEKPLKKGRWHRGPGTTKIFI